MAFVGKTYVTKEEYIEVREFWIRTFKEQKKLFNTPQWLYPFMYLNDDPTKMKNPEKYLKENTQDIDMFPKNKQSAVWNTSDVFDVWLASRCNISCIQKNLANYGDDWVGFKYKDEFIFDFKPFLTAYETEKGSTVYFFCDLKNEIFVYSKLLVYGTTRFLEEFYDIKTILKGHKTTDISHMYKFKFDFYGIIIQYENGVFRDYNGNIIKMPYIGDVDKYFHFPKIKYSFEKKDAFKKKYKPGSIIMSQKSAAFNVDQYEEFALEKIDRYLFLLPDYTHSHIKK